MEFRKLRAMESRPTPDTVSASPCSPHAPSPSPRPPLTLYCPTGPFTAPWRLQEQQSQVRAPQGGRGGGWGMWVTCLRPMPVTPQGAPLRV